VTLLQAINSLRPTERSIDKPLRFCISDIFKSSFGSAISLAGKMEAGCVKSGDKVLILPSNQSGIVKSITMNDNDLSLGICFAGDSVVLNVSNIDMNTISVGHFICDANTPPMPVSERLRAKVVLFNLDSPMIKGTPFIFHYKSMNESAIIKKIISQIDRSSADVIKERPRFLNNGMSGIIELKINRPLCMELYENYKELGRFMLRKEGVTVGAGLITEIL
jgi:elongation factor 1 alpha-like protein